MPKVKNMKSVVPEDEEDAVFLLSLITTSLYLRPLSCTNLYYITIYRYITKYLLTYVKRTNVKVKKYI